MNRYFICCMLGRDTCVEIPHLPVLKIFIRPTMYFALKPAQIFDNVTSPLFPKLISPKLIIAISEIKNTCI